MIWINMTESIELQQFKTNIFYRSVQVKHKIINNYILINKQVGVNI